MAGETGGIHQEFVQVTRIDDYAYATVDGVTVMIHCDLAPLTLQQKARLMRKLADRLDEVAEGF